MKITPRKKRRHAVGREKNEGRNLIGCALFNNIIDLEGNTNFTLQNQAAVKGQKLGLCL